MGERSFSKMAIGYHEEQDESDNERPQIKCIITSYYWERAALVSFADIIETFAWIKSRKFQMQALYYSVGIILIY